MHVECQGNSNRFSLTNFSNSGKEIGEKLDIMTDRAGAGTASKEPDGKILVLILLTLSTKKERKVYYNLTLKKLEQQVEQK